MSDQSLEEIIRAQLHCTLESTNFAGLGELYEGKVRDCYLNDAGERIIVVTDRISAFDVILGTVPFKGQVLNQMAQYWFEETASLVPNHVIRVPDPNVTVARECTPLNAEFVMRSYLTGSTSTSIWRAYERGDRVFCGHDLPEGMVRNERLAKPLLTPSTKASHGDHDVSVSRDQLIEMGAVSAEDFETASSIAHKLFEFGQARAKERGLILVDTKYELGRAPDGEIVVIDEIHTPDSSRYWYADDYDERFRARQEPRSLDKEYVRQWMVNEHGYRGDGPPPDLPADVRVKAAQLYIGTYELITGRPFVPDTTDPKKRIAMNLGVS